MSQQYSQQTRIDQFYKVVSQKNTGYGMSSSKLTPKKGVPQKLRLKNKGNMSPLVKSEVEIIGEVNNKKNPCLNSKSQKRSLLSLGNLSKKLKTDITSTSTNSDINQTPQKSNIQTSKSSALHLRDDLFENVKPDVTAISTNGSNTPQKSNIQNSRSSTLHLRDDLFENIKSDVTATSTNGSITPQKSNIQNLKRSVLYVRDDLFENVKPDDTAISSNGSNYQTPQKTNSQSPKSSPLIPENSFKNINSDVTTPITNSSNNQTPQKTNSQSPKTSSEKKGYFTPRKTPNRSDNSLTTSPNKPKFSPRKLFFADRIDKDTVRQALDHLNFVREGRINQNEFDLPAIYRDKKFIFAYSDSVVPNPQKFELKDVVFPQEKHADHLLMSVMDVFSKPANCGYFLKNELDSIFALFTLSAESQMLFVRLLKRKLAWHRASSIKYPEIANDLSPFFKELVHHKFCISDVDTTDITILLNMLQVDEVRSVCQKLKIDHKGNKQALIDKLLKYGNSSKSFFLGARSPKSVLRSNVLSTLQSCICLPENIIHLFDRVLTLLHPVQDPSESIADLFLIFTSVHKGELLYPHQLENEFFPIFCNRMHLIEFVKSKNSFKEILAAIERKDWEVVRDLGRTALSYLSEEPQKEEETTCIPFYIRKFVPAYTWIKVLSTSVDAFKKTPETIPEAVDILKTLIEEKRFFQNRRGRWYSEMALIEMYHRKDLETSAALTVSALEKESLTEVDISELLERLKKLLRRKSGISKQTKENIQRVLKNIEEKGLAPQPASTKTITANMANRAEAGGKSTWSITTNGNDKYYGSVEMLALQHYTSEEEFHSGLHCEGSLPVTLFAIFFWEELYNLFVPGTYVSPYQYAPLDLFTAEFFNNRKSAIEEKLSYMRALDLESFTEWMCDRYSSYNQYKSVIANSLFKDSQQFKDVVTCLGINGVIGICERLVSNFRLWRSGFPDLIVWNVLIPMCKIVEVKGPGDSLSEKQKLWLQYLEQLGIPVEVCHVQATGRGSK